jgi:hypothetical protein
LNGYDIDVNAQYNGCEGVIMLCVNILI